MVAKKRDYKKEYRDFHGKRDKIADRASRNKARATKVKSGVARKGDGKDVDHKDSNPRNNSGKNLRMQTKKQNRSRK